MIDLGISKLALIGVVALIVIGPEKLPKVARMAGTLFGRAQRYINEVKSEVSREIELDELRQMHKDAQEAVQDVGQSIAKGLSETQNDIRSAWQDPETDSSLLNPPSVSHLAFKAKDFRRKKIAKTSAIPAWYKNRHGGRSHVMSGAARVAKFRAKRNSSASFF
ncbi:Sec-independent protein translocase protein TatB [Undibacterium sp. RTI2.1]|uniref:Sec-independent protein translocase protein TatB n=1 Tax=unclassified Undibacterium TaxID=2630295 RepID=UPI002AB525C3|nr:MULTISPECIES: Sec-independent protein translocase protein TatB [unclassified Undibacterium]MDY7540196.1 Sec-independent protein translocase protein TatB [Undibacterium sp. 5I1]MEB0030370.1 Sec-independent protein translocase protein TatB [Undibacterium sp. RTI2.1]MEB0115349.1 Sec-independent protein translocase protein TatB [Undibacterium sp. RTI2.2]MEB0232535.1 Sec-independent protein translocase protein TatB [Undibacterium sp. 10I3]MEB0257123.1 Sec-independent protein translocase protein 